MRFALLIAGDTIRSVRRHRVMLAFLLVALAGAALVTTGISNAARHQRERADHATAPAPDAPAGQAGPAVGEAKMRQIETMFNGLFGLAVSELGSLLALVLFCTIVSSEVHTGTIRVTLAKPVPRWAYLLGKCLGATVVLALFYVLTGTAAGILGVHYALEGPGGSLTVPWLGFCGSLVLGAVGLVYSLFMRAPVAGVLAWFTSATWFGWCPPLATLLPSYQGFAGWIVVIGGSFPRWHVLLMTLYAVDLVAILLLVAFARFRRMEIA